MNLFLRAKHWQVFLVTFGLPFVLQMTLVVTIVYNIIQNHDPSLILGYLKFLPFVVILCSGGLYFWQWSVAIGLQKKIPEGVNMKVTQFKIFFFIPMVYLVLFSVFISSMFNSDILHGGQPNLQIFYLFPIIFPLHLFSMFCLFYCIYFVAKTIKTVELQREAIFSDFVAEFFLVWFHFIGVWILQPRINKMAEENTTDSAEL
jgi:hypothetical protein